MCPHEGTWSCKQNFKHIFFFHQTQRVTATLRSCYQHKHVKISCYIDAAISDWMNPWKSGRNAGNLLFEEGLQVVWIPQHDKASPVPQEHTVLSHLIHIIHTQTHFFFLFKTIVTETCHRSSFFSCLFSVAMLEGKIYNTLCSPGIYCKLIVCKKFLSAVFMAHSFHGS